MLKLSAINMPYAMSAPLMTCIMSRLGETCTDPQQAEVEEPLFFMYLFILLYLIFYYYFIYIYIKRIFI